MSQTTLSAIEAEISRHEAALAEAKAKLIKAQQESPESQLANELHARLCRWNHTDGCSWYYEFEDDGETHIWSRPEHKKYLGKARAFIHKCKGIGVSVDKAMKIIGIVEEL